MLHCQGGPTQYSNNTYTTRRTRAEPLGVYLTLLRLRMLSCISCALRVLRSLVVTRGRLVRKASTWCQQRNVLCPTVSDCCFAVSLFRCFCCLLYTHLLHNLGRHLSIGCCIALVNDIAHTRVAQSMAGRVAGRDDRCQVGSSRGCTSRATRTAQLATAC